MFATLLLLLFVSSIGHAEAAHEGVTLTDLLTSSAKFTVLIDLLEYTDLLTTVSTLPNATIFAPTDYSFKQTAIQLSGSDTSSTTAVGQCFKDLGKDVLSNVLKYHVLTYALPSASVVKKYKFATLLGESFTRGGLRLRDNNDEMDNPKLLTTMLDLRYQYGYVHAISLVLMPKMETKSDKTIIDVLKASSDFDILLRLLDVGMLTTGVSAITNATVFAPTDRAFRKTAMELGCEDVSTIKMVEKCIMDMFTTDEIATLLGYHISFGIFPSSKLVMEDMIEMYNGVFIYQRRQLLIDQAPSISNAKLISGMVDMKFYDGYIHAISRVMIPFRDIVPPKPCDTFEFPISLADTTFLPLFKIVEGASKCEDVRMAIMDCPVRSKDICSGNRGDKIISGTLKVGRAIAAAKQCNAVVSALRKCPDVDVTLP